MSDLADPDFAELEQWIDGSPEQAAIEIDRHLVREGGLRTFAELAWPTVQGNASTFVGGWHIDAMSEHLEAVSAGQITRLIMMIPPRHMKSLQVAVTWPAWDWIDNAWRQFLFASYAHALSIRDSRRCRRILQSPWFQARWGDRFKITSDQNTKVRFDNDKSGYRLATSVDGMLTGEGGDFIAVDDAHNIRQAESDAVREGVLTWWDEAMSTRLNSPKKGAYVVVGQRVHERDLEGHLLGAATERGWTVLCLPAEYEPDHPHRWARDPRKEAGGLLWEERFGPREVADLKQRLGPYGTAAQLQQRPTPREGGIFKKRWFATLRVAPTDTLWVRGWDFAASMRTLIKADPDYTACVKVGWSTSLQRWIIGHAAHDRLEPSGVEKWLTDMAELDGLTSVIQLPQDPGSAGKALVQRYHTILSRYTVFSEPVTGDKMARAMGWAGKAGAGMVLIVEGEWNKMFLDELTSFPTGAHDDMVDAVSSAFDRVANNTLGIMSWYEQQLVGAGRALGEIKTPYQRREEERAALPGNGEVPVTDSHIEDLARALGYRPAE